MCFRWHYGIIDFCCSKAEAEVNIIDLETIYPFSFEFKGRSLSDTRCMIQYVISPHCGDKRMARRCTRSSLPNYFVMTSFHAGKKRQCKQRKQSKRMNCKNNVTSCTKCSLHQSMHKFINLISTFVICLKFVFIEMLDKLITCIVCWYSILYQVLPVVWTRRYRDS